MRRYREVYLFWEVETASKLITRGIAELQAIDSSNDFYHPMILLLSSGYERLIKCLLCLISMNEKGEIEQSPYDMHTEGHKINILLDKLINYCRERNYSTKSEAVKEDIELLTDSSSFLRKIIDIFTNFASSGRYYNIDMVRTEEGDFKDPIDQWKKLEEDIVKSREDLLQKQHDPKYRDLNSLYKEINGELIIHLERLARALSRIFTQMDFGYPSVNKLAKQVSGPLHVFLFLQDDKLGTKNYSSV